MTAAAAREEKRKKDELFFNYSMDSSIGAKETRFGKHKDAIVHYTKAMQSAEENKVNPLVLARSKEFSCLTQHEAARNDAQSAIKTEPDNIKALENDAFTLYQQDDFEDALIRYYRGLRRRRQPNYFFNGVKVADETIHTCIGRKPGFMLEPKQLGKTIIAMEFSEDSEQRDETEIAKKRKNTERSERYFSERYLRALAKDKTFFQECLKNPDINSSNAEHNEQLNAIIKDTLDVIDRQKETLMTRCPVYVLKNEEPKMSDRMQLVKDLETLASKNGAQKVIDRLFMEAEEANKNQDIERCFHFTYRAQRFIASQPKKLFSDDVKNVLNNYIYDIIGKVYMDMKEMYPGLSAAQNEQRILYMLGMELNNKKVYELVKKTVTPIIFDIKKYQRGIEAQLEVSYDSLERTYLYHELAWTLALLGQHELSRKAAVSGYRMARRIDNIDWCINNAFLVARADINQTYVDEAKIALYEAINKARKSRKKKCVIFLEKILELCDDPDTIDLEGPQTKDKKEDELINLMPTQAMRLEASNLQRKMNNLPTFLTNQGLRESVISKKTLDRISRKTKKMQARAKRQTLMESGSKQRYQSMLVKIRHNSNEEDDVDQKTV